MDKIKPFAWANKCAKDGYLYGIEDGPDGEDTHAYAVEVGDEAVPLYDQSTIDALRAEVEALRNGMTPRGDDMIVPMTLLDEINAVSAGYMADALRYRWLRECSVVRSDVPCYVIWPTYDNGRFIENTYPDHGKLDAAIDSAMKDSAP